MRNNLWIGSGISGMGEIPILGRPVRNLASVVRDLFKKVEQGFAYDPNDLTTLYQDAAGTIPVTAAGQPVGLMLDKSKGLSISTERLQSPIFEADVWAGFDASISFVDGKMIRDGSKVSGSSTAYNRNKAGNQLIVGKSYRLEITVESMSGVAPYIRTSGVVGQVSFNKVGSNVSIVTMAIQGGLFFIGFPAGTSCVISNISIKELAGNHAYQSVSASRPILQRNATTGAYYLAFDGVDDFLQTNNIDFTATDKVSLFAGLNVVAGASTGCVIEIGTSATANNGSFGLFKGPTVIQWASRGTMSVVGAKSTSPAYLDVLCAKAAINTPLLTVRRNAILNIDDNRTQGTGNFGNYPLFIGRRGGNQLPFSGHLYSLIGIVRLTSDSETIALEKAIAKNVGVTFNV